MNNRRKVYVYNSQSGIGCLGPILILGLIIFLLIFFTRIFIQLFPAILLITSTIAFIRTSLQMWQWRKQKQAADHGGFIEKNGVIEPIEAPSEEPRNDLKQRLFLSIVGIILAILLIQYL